MIILRQKEYAKRDYEGLSEEGKAELKKLRNTIAEDLRNSRNQHNEYLSRKIKQGKKSRGLKGREFRYDNSLEYSRETANQYKSRVRDNDLKRQKLTETTPTPTPKPEQTPNVPPQQTAPKPKTQPTTTPKPNPNTTQTNKMGEGWLKKNWKKLGKGGKTAVIGVPVAAAAIGTGVAIKKHNDKKKPQPQNNI